VGAVPRNRSSIRSTQPATPYWSVIFIFYL
jgi:hypothetical protein